VERDTIERRALRNTTFTTMDRMEESPTTTRHNEHSDGFTGATTGVHGGLSGTSHTNKCPHGGISGGRTLPALQEWVH
jgi:hypothetical protein